ncbi:10809_t:CDS:2, partial [Acaulospora morrowiae]
MNDSIERINVSQSNLFQPSPSHSPASPNLNGGMRTASYTIPPKIPPSDVVHSEDSSQGKTTFYQRITIPVKQTGGSMSISPSSRDVVLAARNGIFIIDLENQNEPPRPLYHLTKWDVADVQWNPHAFRDEWVASTSSQKGLIWNLTVDSKTSVQHILYGHTRTISDINWHPFHPDTIATCSVDTYIHLWDLRNPKRPSRSFCAWKFGATQVKFNFNNEYILASAHDRNIMIWDIRQGSDYVSKITAHVTKVYGIDWNRRNGKNIISCSLDKLVKFWNIDQPDVCQGEICTDSPPVGTGIVTMPQRSENKLYLWNQENPQSPVDSFVGHNDVVKEFVWRIKGGGDQNVGKYNSEFQLVTWSKDQCLRLWPISDTQLRLIGHERGKTGTPSDNKLLRTGDSSHTFRNSPAMDKSEHSLISRALNPSSIVTSELRVIPGDRVNQITALRPSGASTENIS